MTIRSAIPLGLALALTCAPVAAQQIEPVRAEQIAAAEAARADGNFDLARQILASLLSPTPEDSDVMRRLALVEAGDGKLSAARALIAAASARSPDDLDVALARGYILYWSNQFAEAENVAAAIAARDPAYPELAPLQASLARQNNTDGFQLRGLAINVGQSAITLQNGASSTWTSQSIVAAIDLSGKDRLSLGAMRETRDLIDTRLSARLDRRLTSATVYVMATVVPGSDFQEKWSIAAGGELVAAERLTVVADLRFAEFDTGNIIALQPGLRITLAREFDLTARAINLFDDAQGHRLGGSLRLDYRPNDEHSFFAIAATYPDVEADGVQQLRSMAFGFALQLSENLTLSSAASYDDRANSYRRWSGNLGLNLRFGAP